MTLLSRLACGHRRLRWRSCRLCGRARAQLLLASPRSPQAMRTRVGSSPPFQSRSRVTLVIALATVALVAAVFTVARPHYDGKFDDKMIDLAEQDYVSPASVRAAFAAEGVSLRYSYDFANGTVLSDVPKARQGRGTPILVTVGGGVGMVSYGPELTAYDERFENVLVTYGGADDAVVDRLDAAVSELER